MNIWVMGKNGMLAKDILKVFDKNSISYFSTGREIDITNINDLNNFIKNKNIDVVINCAAYTKVDLAEEETEICNKINALGVKNTSEICENKNLKLIHFSSDYVFDGNANKPYEESDATNPINVYGKSKLEGEKYALSLSSSLVIRISWLYGVNGNNFVYTMLNFMKNKDSIKVVNDQYGSPTNTLDVANLILYIIKDFRFGLYHYTNEGNISWFDFANSIYDLAKKNNILNKECIIEPCKSEEYKTKAKRPKFSVLSKEKIKNDCKINLIDYRESLNSFLKNLA